MTFLIYGANGYSGSLIARTAASRGLRPVLGGRSPTAVAALAAELQMEHRVFELTDAAALDAGLAGMTAVLNCAGPFWRTYKPMVDACLRAGVHYLDITGEIEVFEALAARYGEARSAGVMLLPGAGFDVAPSDCLAVHLWQQLPSANRLTLGIQGLGAISRGTATTMIEQLARGRVGLVRHNEKLRSVPLAWKTRPIDFGSGPRLAATMPWGDVSTAFHSTGIPNIEVYLVLPPRLLRVARLGRRVAPLLAAAPLRTLLASRVLGAAASGPSAAERAAATSSVWGCVEDGAGRSVEGRLRTPEAYTLTALAALWLMERVLAGDLRIGYQTPASAYGPDWILHLDGVTRSP